MHVMLMCCCTRPRIAARRSWRCTSQAPSSCAVARTACRGTSWAASTCPWKATPTASSSCPSGCTCVACQPLRAPVKAGYCAGVVVQVPFPPPGYREGAWLGCGALPVCRCSMLGFDSWGFLASCKQRMPLVLRPPPPLFPLLHCTGTSLHSACILRRA